MYIDNEDIKQYISKGVIGLIAGIMVYSFTLKTAQEIADKNTPEIQSVSQLEETIQNQKKILGLNDTICIKGQFADKGMPYAKKIGENQYLVVLTDDKNTEAVLKHEIYHIADGHVDANPQNPILWNLYDMLWAEPMAEIYSVTGLQL